jgi:hypothetical protein
MVNKNKNTLSTFQAALGNLGLLMMTASATLLTVEVPERHQPKVIVPAQPLFAVADQGAFQPGHDSEQRRERDEIHPHYGSYSTNQRTPARSGRA